MTWRFLFDQNLSPRLVEHVAARFPESIHVLELGLATSQDVDVLVFAAEQGLIVVTKNSVAQA